VGELTSDEKATLNYQIRCKQHFKYPNMKHPDETDEAYRARHSLFTKTGVWTYYQEDPKKFRDRAVAQKDRAAARRLEAEQRQRDRNMPEILRAGAKTLAECGMAAPADASLEIVAHQVARIALFTAAAKMGELDAGKAMAAGERAIRIRQLLSGEPTAVVGFQNSEKMARLMQIAHELQKLGPEEGDVIDADFSERRIGSAVAQGSPDPQTAARDAGGTAEPD